jgi:flagellar basal body-associated protein FliL
MRKLNPSLAVFIALSLSTTVATAGEGVSAKPKGPAPKRPPTSLKSWVMVDPFTISVIQDGGVRGTFTVNFGMDVPDNTLRQKAETLMPRLRDAWLRSLNLYAATTLRPRRQADVVELAARIQQTADDVLGAPGAKVLMAEALVNIPQ